MSEKVSVIIPVYKVEKYLNRCVESVVNQTYNNLEIILVDDGSPDNCPQMCDDWAEKDDRIKVIHKGNSGIGMARNSGMEIATGDYLMFVDSDDYLSENAVEVLYERIKKDNSDLAVGKHADVDENGVLNDTFCQWMKIMATTSKDIFAQMGQTNRLPVVAWNKLYKKDIFEGVSYPSLTCGEDCWIFADIIEKCEKISIASVLTYYYYQRSDSIFHQKTEQRQLDDIRANLKLSHYLFENDYFDGARKWYEIALDKASYVKDKKMARSVFRTFFSDAEERGILKKAGAKLQMKWLCQYVPHLRQAMRAMKHTVRRSN